MVCKMKPLAQRALDNQNTKDRIDFFPGRFENTFNRWMEEIRDWTISRQLWWGHQIPAWYHKDTGKSLLVKKHLKTSRIGYKMRMY